MRWTALIVFVLVLGTAFIFLGRWQLDRLHERRAKNTVIRTNEKADVASFDKVFDRPVTQAREYRRVKVSGTFKPSKQVIIRYRSNGDADGYEVVTPMRTSQGKWLLVDRGFVAKDKGSIPKSAPPPPTGRVTVTGRARSGESGKKSATVPVNGHARLIDPAKIGDWAGHPVVDGYLDTISMTPKDTSHFRQRKLPELSDGPHFWYAVQWFMFTGIGVTGVVVFIRGDVRERRAARVTDRPGSDQPGDTRPAAARTDPQQAADEAAEPAATGRATTERRTPSRRLRRAKPSHPVQYGDTQAPPGWKPPDSD